MFNLTEEELKKIASQIKEEFTEEELKAALEVKFSNSNKKEVIDRVVKITKVEVADKPCENDLEEKENGKKVK